VRHHPDGWELPEPLDAADAADVDRLVSDDELPDYVLDCLDEYTPAELLDAKRDVLAARLQAERDEARCDSRRSRWGDD
jgi:hypothetical protein